MTDLNNLWTSTENLHLRFTGKPNMDAQRRVFAEEAFEFMEATFKGDVDAMIDEGLDVLVSMMSTLQSAGVTYEDFTERMIYVVTKNDAKTLDTHFVDGKNKIRRIEAPRQVFTPKYQVGTLVQSFADDRIYRITGVSPQTYQDVEYVVRDEINGKIACIAEGLVSPLSDEVGHGNKS